MTDTDDNPSPSIKGRLAADIAGYSRLMGEDEPATVRDLVEHLTGDADAAGDLEFDLESPIWRHPYRELAKDHALIRYDPRGNGPSDRAVDDIPFDAFVSDLETVADAAKLTRFALLGISRGCPLAIAYAVLLPRVSVPRLVLHAREDARVPFEAGRRMAAGIPGARFLALTGRNHLFLETEPVFGQFLEHTRTLLAG